MSASETYTGEASTELEHGTCALGDAIIPGKGTISGTLTEVLSAMLGYQMVQAGGAPLWALGSVATNAQASFDHDSTNLLSAVLAVVPDGYMLTFDQRALPWRLGVAKMAETAECEGRLSRNLRGVTVTVDDEDFCTRIYCNMLPAPGYMDGPTVGTWGVKAKTITAQENVTQESLTAYITQYLEDHKNPRVSIECDAEDLSSITGERIDRMEKGRLFRLALPDYGVAMEERILAVRTGSAYDEPERVRLTLANSIRDTADTLVYIENSVNGGASSSSARGGYVRGGGGSGISPASVLDMLKKAETYITEDEAWTRESGIRIESNTAEMYATKKAIVGGWTGDVETVDALIRASTDNGGLVAMLVGRKNSAEEVNAAISATAAGGGLITLKASQADFDKMGKRVDSAEASIKVNSDSIELKVSKNGVISAINQTAESVKISASKINLEGYVTASKLSAEFANFESSIADSLYVRALSSSTFECTSFSFKGNGMSLKSATFLTSSTSLTVNSTGGTVTGVNLNKKTNTIYYMSWE